MWEYDEAVKLVEEFGIDTKNDVSVGNIESMIIAEYEFECDRMKNNGRTMTPKAKLEARGTIISRVNMWMSDGFVGEVTAKTLTTYRPSYLFFKLLANTIKK